MTFDLRQFGAVTKTIAVILGCVAFSDVVGGSGTLGNAKNSPTTSPARYESYGVILLLEQGPVHARFGIAMQGRPITQQRNSFIQNLIERLDVNDDRRLSLDEANKSHLLRQKSRAGTARFLKYRNLTSKQTKTIEEVVRVIKATIGRVVIFRQSNDAMKSDDYLFELLDEDSSGVIDTSEMESAAERLIKLDTDDDQCVGFDEVQPPQELAVNAVGAVQQELSPPERPQAVFSEILRLADEPSLPHRLMRRYDRNKNGKLSSGELGWESSRIESIDKNGDGELARSELKNIGQTPVDLDLTIDVAPPGDGQPELHIRRNLGKRLDTTERPGIVNLMLQNNTLTLSYRHVDPIPDALANARRKFNILDGDANGYVDLAEVEGETLLQQGLFSKIDADEDDRIFFEELDAYVTERATPKGMSCRVSIFDTGSGIFQAMDHNNDGRISIREIKKIKRSLLALDNDAKPGVSKGEPPRHFHIEFARGSFFLFGPSAQMSAQAVSFNTHASVGPAWFIGSDRNNDGDLTWNEFLGHREDFHFLDVDRDDLVDPTEAKRAEQLRHDN